MSLEVINVVRANGHICYHERLDSSCTLIVHRGVVDSLRLMRLDDSGFSNDLINGRVFCVLVLEDEPEDDESGVHLIEAFCLGRESLKGALNDALGPYSREVSEAVLDKCMRDPVEEHLVC